VQAILSPPDLNVSVGVGIMSTMMDIRPNRTSLGPWRFWQRLVSAAAIYALIIQPLLLSVAGAQLANAAAIDDVSLSQLCLHATDGSPLAPADQHPVGHHCVLCFTGAFHFLDAPRSVTVRYVSSEIGEVEQWAHPLRLSSFARYSVARPRGPPLNA
jgi:hypothetical protein